MNGNTLPPLATNGKSLTAPVPVKTAPILAGAIVNKGIVAEFEDTPMADEELSIFSSRAAITFWESSNIVYAVDSYENAMRVSSLAAIDDSPILLWGKTSENAVKKLNALNVIGIGNLPPGICSRILVDNRDVINYSIERKLPIRGYLSVVNPNSSDPASALAPLLTALRNGVLLTVNGSGANYVHGIVYSIVRDLSDAGIKVDCLAIFGGMESINHYKTQITLTSATGSFEEEIYTDNFYGCAITDNLESLAVPEIAVGRIIALNLTAAKELFARYACYGNNSGDWRNNAVICNANEVPEADPQSGITLSILNMNIVFMGANYNTYTSTAVITRVGRQTLLERISNANFIYSITNQDANGTRIFADVARFNPGIVVDCDAIKEESIKRVNWTHYRVLGTGANAYVAPLLNSWFGISGEISANISRVVPEEDELLQLAKGFFKEMIENNKSIGIALRDAKKSFVGEHPYDGVASMTSMAFTLYGDPAFNPYEPCNEGKNRLFETGLFHQRAHQV